jgi:HEAT repeat protein/Tfp pilus assembly protein PilF
MKAVLDSLQPLLAHLINNFLNGDYQQRRESAIALSKFKGECATDFLLQTYESDNIQDFMALALGNIDSSKAVKLLINALNDSQQEVRFNAAQALGMMENPEAFEILMEALNSYAEVGLNPSEEDITESDEPTTQLFFEEEAIISAILALGKLMNWQSASLLKQILPQEKSPRIRASIIMSLGMMQNERLMPVFQSALRDEDPRVRANAIEAIECLKSGSIVGIIQPYLDDPSNRVKANVAKAIWKYGDYDVSDTLKQMLKHSDKWYRASAAYAIGEIKDSKFIRQLSRCLKDEDPDVRRNAANALRKIEYPDAFPHLKPMLSDPNFDVRVQASLALARCAPDKAGELLIDRLQIEENFIVQATIISCIGQIGSAEMVDKITRFLESEDPRVVSNTIEALKLLAGEPDKDFIVTLKQLLKHEDNRVKSTAIKTLWVCGEYEVLDNLKELFASNDEALVKSATFVLGEIGSEISKSKELLPAVNNLISQLIEKPERISASINENLKETQKPAQSEKDEPKEAPETTTEEKEKITKPEPPQADTKAVETEEPPSKEEKATSKPQPGRAAPVEKITRPLMPEKTYSEEIEMANSFVAAKNYEMAEKIFKKILSAKKDHLKAILGLGNVHFMQKNYSEAAGYYTSALKINPNLVKAHYNLGSIYYYVRKYQQAAKHLVKALNIYPKILGAYMLLAQIYQIAGKTNESIKLLSKAASLSPRNPIIYQKLATQHIKNGSFNDAIKTLQTAIDLSPVDVESNLMLAYCFNLIGDDQRAFSAMDLTLQACAQSAQPELATRQLLKSYIYLNSIIDDQKPIHPGATYEP